MGMPALVRPGALALALPARVALGRPPSSAPTCLRANHLLLSARTNRSKIRRSRAVLPRPRLQSFGRGGPWR
eukprot:11017642-Lingulodinium_polyedra.AAC.1